jgi:hypothetical protein
MSRQSSNPERDRVPWWRVEEERVVRAIGMREMMEGDLLAWLGRGDAEEAVERTLGRVFQGDRE